MRANGYRQRRCPTGSNYPTLGSGSTGTRRSPSRASSSTTGRRAMRIRQAASLFFSDGTRIGVVGIPDNGEPKVVEFAPKRVRWVKFEVNDAVGSHVGLSEIEAFPPAEAGGDFVSQVDPFIETTKGRYFFFITGNQPFGMIGARTADPQPQPVRRGLQLQFDRGARLPADTQLGAGRAYAHADDRQHRSHPRRRALEIALPHEGEIAQPVTTVSSWRITASGSSRRPLTARGSTA